MERVYLNESVRCRYASDVEVSKYASRAESGLLDWERHVLEKYCQAPGKVLDVGCGGGREAIAFQQAGYEVTAIDISEQQLRAAHAKARELHLPIRFSLCNGTKLDFEDAAFDYVFIVSQVLGNVPGRASRLQLVREAGRVLKPGGVFVSSMHNRDICEAAAREEGIVLPSPPDFEDGDFMLSDVPGKPCYWHYFTRHEILDLCNASGLDTFECCLAADIGQDSWDTVWVCICKRI